MSRGRSGCHLRLPALGFTALVLASACSGVGVRTAVNYYAQMCSDEKAYLQAVAGVDASATSEAVARMRTTANLIPDRQPRVLELQAVDAAAKGDPSLIRQDYRANCLPLPTPSPTTPGALASG